MFFVCLLGNRSVLKIRLTIFKAFDIHVVLDAKFFNYRSKYVFHVWLTAVISIHTATRTLLLLKRLLDGIDFIEAVEFVDDLSEDGLAIASQ